MKVIDLIESLGSLNPEAIVLVQGSYFDIGVEVEILMGDCYFHPETAECFSTLEEANLYFEEMEDTIDDTTLEPAILLGAF